MLSKFSKKTLGLSFFLLFVFVAWFIWATLPLDPRNQTLVTFSIESGESTDIISRKLKAAGLVRSQAAFKGTLVAKGLAKNIQAGVFEISPSWSAARIAQALTYGRSDLRITLLEGWRREEMAEEIAKVFSQSGVQFDSDLFLSSSQGKEGYLFPDTYFIPTKIAADEIVDILQENFSKKVDSDLIASISDQNLSLDQALIFASIVEREAAIEKDRPIIAGILIKRWRENWPLQADATVQYALGHQANQDTWWKKSLTKRDLEINSPFNTYLYTGLPPHPISSPSLSAIKSVADQKQSNYWYYISDPQGNIHYASSIEEHNRNISNYLSR